MAYEAKKYLDFSGLSYYDGKIKTYIGNAISESLKDYVNGVESTTANGAEYIKASLEAGTTGQSIKVEAGAKLTALQGKADKNAEDIADIVLVNNAQQQAIEGIQNNYVKSATGTTDEIVVDPTKNDVVIKLADKVKTSLGLADSAVQSVVEGSTNGTISVDGGEVKVHGLGSAAYTESSAYATAAQGQTADSAVQNVTTGADALVKATKGSNNVVTIDESALSTKLQSIEQSISDKNVSAGATEGELLVSASAVNNKVTVSSTKKLQDAVALAESALQESDVTATRAQAEKGEAAFAALGLSGDVADITYRDSEGTVQAHLDTIEGEIDKINTFFDIEPAKSEALKDTLKEISDYITSDAQISEEFATVKQNYIDTINGDTGNTYVDITFSASNGNASTATINESKLNTKIQAIEKSISDLGDAASDTYLSKTEFTTFTGDLKSGYLDLTGNQIINNDGDSLKSIIAAIDTALQARPSVAITNSEIDGLFA